MNENKVKLRRPEFPSLDKKKESPRKKLAFSHPLRQAQHETYNRPYSEGQFQRPNLKFILPVPTVPYHIIAWDESSTPSSHQVSAVPGTVDTGLSCRSTIQPTWVLPPLLHGIGAPVLEHSNTGTRSTAPCSGRNIEAFFYKKKQKEKRTAMAHRQNLGPFLESGWLE